MKKGIPATTVAQSSKYTLKDTKPLGDVVLVQEDPIGIEQDKGSGLTSEVVDALKTGKLYAPETAEFYINKFPFKGTVIAIGSKVKDIKNGDKVVFARLGGMRVQEGDIQYIYLRESEVLGVLTES